MDQKSSICMCTAEGELTTERQGKVFSSKANNSAAVQNDKSLGTLKSTERQSQTFRGKSPTTVCKEVTEAKPFCAAIQALQPSSGKRRLWVLERRQKPHMQINSKSMKGIFKCKRLEFGYKRWRFPTQRVKKYFLQKNVEQKGIEIRTQTWSIWSKFIAMGRC